MTGALSVIATACSARSQEVRWNFDAEPCTQHVKAEAKRALVDELTGNLLTVAKDVKLQIEFNPAEVQAYRLIGYENRVLADEDFRNDKKDSGDMGAGHNVTAFFEIVPRGSSFEGPEVSPLKYQKTAQLERAPRGELLNVSLRYKLPEATESVLMEAPAANGGTSFESASADFSLRRRWPLSECFFATLRTGETPRLRMS